jgi:hypothetical protein
MALLLAREGEGTDAKKVRLAFPFISFVNRIMGPKLLVFIFLSLLGISSKERYPNANVTYTNTTKLPLFSPVSCSDNNIPPVTPF